MEGAEKDLDIVVGRDLVAVGVRDVHRAMRLPRPDTDVDRGGGIPHEHFRGVAGCDAILGGELREAGKERGPGPGGIVQPAVHHGVHLEPRDGHMQLPMASIERLAWSDADRGNERGHEGEEHGKRIYRREPEE